MKIDKVKPFLWKKNER